MAFEPERWRRKHPDNDTTVACPEANSHTHTLRFGCGWERGQPLFCDPSPLPFRCSLHQRGGGACRRAHEVEVCERYLRAAGDDPAVPYLAVEPPTPMGARAMDGGRSVGRDSGGPRPPPPPPPTHTHTPQRRGTDGVWRRNRRGVWHVKVGSNTKETPPNKVAQLAHSSLWFLLVCCVNRMCILSPGLLALTHRAPGPLGASAVAAAGRVARFPSPTHAAPPTPPPAPPPRLFGDAPESPLSSPLTPLRPRPREPTPSPPFSLHAPTSTSHTTR